jgi:hypothetical protein
MFNKPFSQEDYDAHPASATTFCNHFTWWYIFSSLADLFNRSLTSGSVPAEWKVSNII